MATRDSTFRDNAAARFHLPGVKARALKMKQARREGPSLDQLNPYGVRQELREAQDAMHSELHGDAQSRRLAAIEKATGVKHNMVNGVITRAKARRPRQSPQILGLEDEIASMASGLGF